MAFADALFVNMKAFFTIRLIEIQYQFVIQLCCSSAGPCCNPFLFFFNDIQDGVTLWEKICSNEDLDDNSSGKIFRATLQKWVIPLDAGSGFSSIFETHLMPGIFLDHCAFWSAHLHVDHVVCGLSNYDLFNGLKSIGFSKLVLVDLMTKLTNNFGRFFTHHAAMKH